MAPTRFIVVGAGSAGSILAHQIASRRSAAVTLIEPPATPAPVANRERPSHWLKLLRSSEDWDFATQSTAGLAGRSLRWPRGRGLGGSSRINAMIWFPPADRDFQTLGEHFGIETLQESFAQVERLVQPEGAKWISRATTQFMAAACKIQHGESMIYRRVNRDGRRWNPASLLDDLNINIVRVQVDQVLFRGDRAVGVQLTNGETIHGDTIVLCAGAITTPMILMRSGIGPADVLSDCGIDLRQESPAVGGNLQDHLIMPVVFGVDAKHRFESEPTPGDIDCWETVGGGPLASNIAEAGGLFADGTIQIHVTPTHYLKYPSPTSPAAMTIGVNVTQPESRGRITIESRDPNSPPVIQPNYLSNPADLNDTIQGVRLAREIAQLEPLASLLTGELLPGAKRESDESIAKSIARYAQTLYHPVGTCTDLTLNTENLHIVDASILPRLTVGNPNATVMMLAHALADKIV